jgi:hypothetical protein
MAREQRIGRRGEPDREDQERGEHRFRDEQLGDTPHVAEDPSPLVDHRRDGRELAAHEDDVGDRTCHLGAGPLRDRESCRLQSGHVVGAVADHRDVMALGGQQLHDASLVLGRDARQHGVLGDRMP